MYRTRSYIALFAACVLLQLFLFDNLSVSIYLCPLVYVAFLALMPLDAAPVALLGAGAALGAVMDCATGAAGLHTLATLPVAFLRPMIAGAFCGRENAREGGIPSPERMGLSEFAGFLVSLVLLHHALYFAFETLSWSHAGHTAARIVVSGAATVAVSWLLMRLFTAKLPKRI